MDVEFPYKIISLPVLGWYLLGMEGFPGISSSWIVQGPGGPWWGSVLRVQFFLRILPPPGLPGIVSNFDKERLFYVIVFPFFQAYGLSLYRHTVSPIYKRSGDPNNRTYKSAYIWWPEGPPSLQPRYNHYISPDPVYLPLYFIALPHKLEVLLTQ